MKRFSNKDINPASQKSRLDYQSPPIMRTEHNEGSFTRMIEQQTAKIPSDIFLFSALGAMGASLIFEIRGKERASRFVGQWAPTLLAMGIYNKLVKVLSPR